MSNLLCRCKYLIFIVCNIRKPSHLVSIHSESEYASALNTLDNNPYVYTRVWTGLNDINITDIWEWSDGSPFDYGNITDPLSTQNYLLKGNGPWRSDEPDYNDSDNAVAIEVGSKYASRYNSRSWVDRQPEANYQFMCNSCSSKLHKYVAVNNARNYSDARSICQQYLGTDLASIHSDADFEEVKFTCKQISASAGCWIGLNDIAAGGRQFEWTGTYSLHFRIRFGEYSVHRVYSGFSDLNPNDLNALKITNISWNKSTQIDSYFFH